MSDDDSAKRSSVYFLVMSVLLALVLILSKELQKRPRLNSVLSEAALVLFIGITVSFFVNTFIVTNQAVEDDMEQQLARSLLSFRSNVFFMALLPPIMFNSGYQLRRELFYRHITPILLFAGLGTTVSALATSFALYGVQQLNLLGGFDPTLLELLTFGALIAATDTVSTLAIFQTKRVNPNLFYMVFGESALNDAVAIVLFKTFSDFVGSDLEGAGSVLNIAGALVGDFLVEAICSPILGILFSFVAALIFKYSNMQECPMLELALYMLMMYIPFILAETVGLSGIVTIFFSGMSARRYIQPNVSDDTSRNADVIFKLAAYLAEVVVFLELGLSVFGLEGSFDWIFIGWAFLASLIGRALSIYPISVVYNWSLGERVASEMTDDGSASSGSVSSTSRSSASRKRKTPKRRRDLKISPNMMHSLWFAGIRGAVSYACVREFPNTYGHNDEFTAATMVIVLATIVLMGGAMEHLLIHLKIEMNVDEEDYMKEWHRRRKFKGHFHRLGKSSRYIEVLRCSHFH
jgi:sodium/hydrogen exchanger 8